MDTFGKSDPYTVVTYEDQTEKTPVVKKCLDPVWETEMWFNVSENGDRQVIVEVFDKDKVGKDEVMGRTTIDIRRVSRQGSLTQVWDKLLGCKSGKLCWSAEFFPDQGDPNIGGQLVTDNLVQVPDNTNFVKPDDQPTAPVELPVHNPDSPSKGVSGADISSPDLIPAPITEIAPKEKEWRCTYPIEDLEPRKELVLPVNLGELSEPVDLLISPNEGSLIAPEPQVCVYPVEDMVFTEDGNYADRRVTRGFLRVTVHRAEDLVDKDKMGKSDPYVIVRYGGQKNKSEHVKSCLDPDFEFSTGYVIEEDGEPMVLLEVKDHDTIGKNESLGTTCIDLRQAMAEPGGLLERIWLPLQGVPRGRLEVSLQFDGETEEQITEDFGLRRRGIGSKPKVRLNLLYDENKEEVKLFLHEAANLPGEDLPDPPDPQVKVYLMPGKKKKKKSEVVKDNGNPKFDEEFDFSVDFEDLPKHSIRLVVIDKKGIFAGKSPVLGSLDISLDNPGLRHGLADWFPLEEATDDSD